MITVIMGKTEEKQTNRVVESGSKKKDIMSSLTCSKKVLISVQRQIR